MRFPFNKTLCSLSLSLQKTRRWPILNVCLLTLLFCAYGCALFLSPYNLVSYQYLTELKAFHLKFIEVFTEDSTRTYNRERIQESFDVGDLKFQEALAYEKNRSKDKSRLMALEILHKQFQDDADFLFSRAALYRKDFAAELKKEVEENYDQAIKGELIRKGSPANQ